jgi:tetratricopeptide (TPR) repeat protein
MKTCLRWMCVVMIALAAALAQPQSSSPASRGYAVRGEISSGSVVTSTLTVELTSSSSSFSDTATVNGDGTFEFRSAPPGTYWLRVFAGAGGVIHEELVSVGSPGQILSVRLNERSSANRSAGSTVSLHQLTHKVPRQAQKAYDKGRQAAHKGDQHAAQGFFQQAVDADPEFVEAHNELGASEVALGELPAAAEQFQKAIDIVPEHPLALPNLSIVLAKLKRLHEAGEVARRALLVLPGDSRMHYILALSLLAENKQTTEALNSLHRASTDIPKAHIVAAEVLANTGRRDEAVLELEEYLRVQPTDDKERPTVEARLAELRH